jgi:hypothetical protein
MEAGCRASRGVAVALVEKGDGAVKKKFVDGSYIEIKARTRYW